jgi:hypothetical protein
MQRFPVDFLAQKEGKYGIGRERAIMPFLI